MDVDENLLESELIKYKLAVNSFGEPLLEDNMLLLVNSSDDFIPVDNCEAIRKFYGINSCPSQSKTFQIASTSQPTSIHCQSTIATSNSTTTTFHSTTSRPATTTSQFTVTTLQPTATNSQPTATNPQPTATNPQSTATTSQSIATNSQSIATNSQSIGTNSQSIATNSQSIATNSQLTATNSQLHATPGIPSFQPQQGKGQSRWTLQLIEEWRIRRARFENNIEKNDTIWLEIMQELNKRGYNFTLPQIENKFKYLKKKYTDCVDYNKKSTGECERFCTYYEELHKLFQNSPQIKPPGLAASRPLLNRNQNVTLDYILPLAQDEEYEAALEAEIENSSPSGISQFFRVWYLKRKTEFL